MPPWASDWAVAAVLALRDFDGPGTRGLATDVEQVRALLRQPQAMRHRRVDGRTGHHRCCRPRSRHRFDHPGAAADREQRREQRMAPELAFRSKLLKLIGRLPINEANRLYKVGYFL